MHFIIVFLSTNRSQERKFMNRFRNMKLEQHIFQQYFSLPIRDMKKSRANPPLVPSTPIILTRSTITLNMCFKYYGYINLYPDIGTRTKILYLGRLLVPRIQQHKYIHR
jgi:hypothetical protein